MRHRRLPLASAPRGEAATHSPPTAVERAVSFICLGSFVTIDTSRTQEWNGGFQIYIVVPQWVEGSLVEVDLGPTVQSLDQCANRSASE